MAKVINVGGYELSTQIGEGAFSKVYLGSSNDPSKNALHRSVAIKVVGVPSTGVDVASYKKKILKEVKLHKVLINLNILRLLDWSEGKGGSSIWIVLEYAHGGDLFDKITPDVGISEELAHLYFSQLISAIKYCHASGIVHRDIKPENMLLDDSGNLKLADFGLAELFRYQGKEKKLKEACGSAPYAAPELALGDLYRAEPIDVWSCGIVLFTLLVGNTPWDQPTPASEEYSAYLSQEIIQVDPWTRIPEGLLSMLMNILHPAPKQRYKVVDIELDPWYQIENPLMNAKGQVSDRTALWDRLINELNDAGEFQIRSQFSDESQADSEMSSIMSQQQQQDGVVPQQRSPLSQLGVDLPQGSMQRSQGRRDNVFTLANRMEGMDIVEREKVMAERKVNADAAVQQGLMVRHTMEKSMKMGGTGATASASRYSQVYDVAPSQIGNPNVTRLFSYANLPVIVQSITNALQALHVKYEFAPESRGAAMHIAYKDRRHQNVNGTIYIIYEATPEDYENIAPDAPRMALTKMRKGALTMDDDSSEADENEDEATIKMQPRLGHGLGQGGYVVQLLGKGDPLERKRLFKKVQDLLPDGVVFAR